MIKSNPRFVYNGIKEQLVRFVDSDNDKMLLREFCKLMSDKGVEPKNCEEWYTYNVLPDKFSAFKMCFTFRLSDKSAAEFLMNTCRINGFNPRLAEDIIYKYALDHNKSCEYAEKLIERYKADSTHVIFAEGDETKSTATLNTVFRNLEDMDEDEFVKNLVENKKNFIGYYKTSIKEFIEIYNSLVALVLDITNESNETIKSTITFNPSTCSDKHLEINLKFIFDGFILALITKKIGDEREKVRKMLLFILDTSQIGKSTIELRSAAMDSAEAKDFGHGLVRMLFVLCFFTRYMLKWVKRRDSFEDSRADYSFYNDFYIGLNVLLNRCSYGMLYPAHPFDKLILKCVKNA
ncbi:MAG: hypothetical protein LBC73_09250 [Oscillospiraceae bacterium]|nr:hypothetical protein [Oscillospiraceae bacterium]